MLFNSQHSNDTTWQVDTADYSGGALQIITGFQKPYGLAVRDDGHLFVPDLEEGRVVAFFPGLAFEGWLGSVQGVANSESGWHQSGLPERGTGHGELYMPHSVAFDQTGNLIVGDYMPTVETGRIHRYSSGGNYLGLFFQTPGDTSLTLKGVSNVYIDPDFNWWVSDFDGNRVFKFRPDGSLVGWVGMRAGGELTDGFATTGAAMATSAPGGFYKPHMVLVDDSRAFLVAETGNHRIQKFDSTGRFVGWIGARSDGSIVDGWTDTGLSGLSSLPGGFFNPVSVRPISSDSFLVADNGNHRIQKFTRDGRFVAWLGGKAGGEVTQGWETAGQAAAGAAPGAFDTPFDAVSFGGKLYVADGHNGRVQIFELN